MRRVRCRAAAAASTHGSAGVVEVGSAAEVGAVAGAEGAAAVVRTRSLGVDNHFAGDAFIVLLDAGADGTCP